MDAADKIWKTCCAFHNWLLEVDGLDEKWDGVLGEQTDDDLQDIMALRRLKNPIPRNYDTSGMGYRNDRIEEVLEDDMQMENTSNYFDMLQDVDNNDAGNDSSNDSVSVRTLSFDYFRKKLVNHFEIAYERKEIVWPKSIKSKV